MLLRRRHIKVVTKVVPEPKKQITDESKSIDYSDYKWQELTKLAKEKEINIKGLKRPEVEQALIEAGE